MTGNLTPGTLIVVRDNTLVRRWGSEEEHYTQRLQNGMVLQQLAYLWREGEYRDSPTYLVLFSNDMRIYLVPADSLLTPDQATDPGRLFGRLRG